MEARLITVTSTQTQTTNTFMSEAETLGQLKDDMRANAIQFGDDMTFFEGISQTELKSNDAILPHDIPYKGTITNKLVFMVTQDKKKIDSGAGLTRQECYEFIKNHTDLKNTISAECYRSYTNCSTNVLNDYIDEYNESNVAHNEEPVNTGKITFLVDTIKDIATKLQNEVNRLMGLIEDKTTPYTQEEINKMFNH